MAGKPARLPSSNQVTHATALVQRAEKEASLCDAAVRTLHTEVEKMEEALERAQMKAQAASGCFGACFPPEIPTDHPAVLRIAETKDTAESLKDRKLAMTLHTEKVNRLIASMAKEAGGQRSWKSVFPDHRLQDLKNTTMELENYLNSTTVAQQAAIGLALDPLHGAPGQPGDAELSIEPSAPPMPQDPVTIERLMPECPLCLEPIKDLACGPCGHVFCDECIKGAIVAMPHCPICRHCMTVDQIHRIFMG